MCVIVVVVVIHIEKDPLLAVVIEVVTKGMSSPGYGQPQQAGPTVIKTGTKLW